MTPTLQQIRSAFEGRWTLASECEELFRRGPTFHKPGKGWVLPPVRQLLVILLLVFVPFALVVLTQIVLGVGFGGNVGLAVHLVYAALVYTVVSKLGQRERRRRARTQRGACRRCGYDLSGSPNVTVTLGDEERSIGPETCPECGGRWPMILP